MGFFTDWLDRQFKASWERQQRANKLERAYAPLVSADRSANYMQSKTFTVRDALNGKYIEVHKHQFNPNGPDVNEQCVYIVKDNETLIDAISVVLVLMDKES
jgi:hypothetical protein